MKRRNDAGLARLFEDSMSAFDPTQAFKVRLSRKFVGGAMRQVRRRQFLIAAAKALGPAIPQSVLPRAGRVIE
jgi:archaellum biogenesis ATPase FlaH